VLPSTSASAHQDDLVYLSLEMSNSVMDPGAQRRDHRVHLIVLQHPVDPGLLHVRILPRIGRIAWYMGSRPPLAEPPAESPSTT